LGLAIVRLSELSFPLIKQWSLVFAPEGVNSNGSEEVSLY
jgi:hypothetical protein